MNVLSTSGMNRQIAQAERNRDWQKEGHLEWPVQLATYLKPHQVARLEWLKANVAGLVLEVGCSWGYVLAYVGGHAGIDLNPESISIAKQLAREKRFEVGSALSLPLPDRSYDTVLLADVLEHLDYADVSQALSEACRVSRQRVLITLPKGDSDTEDATNMKHRWLCTKEIAERLFGKGTQTIAGFYCIFWGWEDVRNTH